MDNIENVNFVCNVKTSISQTSPPVNNIQVHIFQLSLSSSV